MELSPSAYYERHLPHWQPEHRPIFLTWRLHGSLPRDWTRTQRTVLPGQTESTARSIVEAGKTSSPTVRPAGPGRFFRRMDSLLDRAAVGPLWLKNPEVADTVARAFLFGQAELKLYRLHAWVIMANHVHLLVEALSPLARITKAVKGYTAREANRFLGRKGESFWQDESFDHWARDEKEANRLAAYIEGNPVAVGLVQKPEDWRWSSANRLTNWTQL